MSLLADSTSFSSSIDCKAEVHYQASASFLTKLVLIMATEVSPNEVLATLDKSNGPVITSETYPKVPFVKIKSALDTLRSRDMITFSQIEREEAVLTPEAEGIVKEGSHEAKVFEAVRAAVEGLSIADLPVRWLDCTPA